MGRSSDATPEDSAVAGLRPPRDRLSGPQRLAESPRPADRERLPTTPVSAVYWPVGTTGCGC